MKIKQIFILLSLSALTLMVSCKPKDSELQKHVTEVLSVSPGVTVEVKDGVATLSGTVTDPAIATAAAEAAAKVKGIKSVSNNISVEVPAPPPAPVAITADDALNTAVTDALKDFPGVTAAVTDGVITVSGKLSASKWKTLKMALDNLHPKKVDAKGMTIQ